jgi:hypothetical protein
MRICDDRYTRERARLELALRFLRHEARTQTIRAWTGLSDDRIRKLYRHYLGHERAHPPRHRGKSPRQVAYFTRSQRAQEETTLLASILSLFGVVPTPALGAPTLPWPALGRPGSERTLTPGVSRGELLCQAFEAFCLVMPSAETSFEHAVFLVATLSCGDQLRLTGCVSCGSVMVSERFPLRAQRCPYCAGTGQSRC